MWSLLMFSVCLAALAMLVLGAEFLTLRIGGLLGHQRPASKEAAADLRGRKRFTA